MIPDQALDADIAILAKKGSGKTYTARGIVERLLLMERRVLILDPLSTWWGLKSSADGEGPGFPVAVFGGPHGDMPLTEAMARPLGSILAAENLPTVIDMGDLTKAASMRIVRDLLDELYQKNRDPLTIVLEEADEFAPQQPREGDSQAVFSQVDRIARRGRAFGFRLISITQRPARLHKDVLTQLSTLIAMRISSPQDRDTMKAWVEGNADRDKAKEVMASLATLATGEGWVWAPDFDILERVRFPAITTLDTSATPKAGERRIVPKQLAQIDLGPLKNALEVQPESKTAKGEAVDESERAFIINAAYDRGYGTGRLDGLAEGAASERARIMAEIEALFREQPVAMQLVHPRTDQNPIKKPAAKVTAPVERQAIPTPYGHLPKSAEKMLAVLDTNPPVRMSWNAVAASIGNKARGGHFNATRKALITGGHVIEEGGLVRIAHPRQDAPAPEDKAERAAHLRGCWQLILGGRAAQIISLLAGAPLTKEVMARQLGCAATGGHWNSAWKALRDNDLITETGGVYRLTEELAG